MRHRALLVVLAWLVPLPLSAQSESVEYYGTDAIGSVRVVFDGAGNILTRMDYHPFGGELASASGLPPERFAQLTRDGEAGLDYAQARMYQPRTGRFGAPDAVFSASTNPQNWNRYTYALNNPTGFIDPSGFNPEQRTIQPTVNCGIGAYWCPGTIYVYPGDSDKYFDPRAYGYQGGEEMERAEAAYAAAVTAAFAQRVAAAVAQESNRQSGVPRASVSTTAEVTLPDGSKVKVRDATLLDALAEAGRIAGPMADAKTYALILFVSSAGGVMLEFGPGAVTAASAAAITPAGVDFLTGFAQGFVPTPPPPTPAGYAGFAVSFGLDNYVIPWVRRRVCTGGC